MSVLIDIVTKPPTITTSTSVTIEWHGVWKDDFMEGVEEVVQRVKPTKITFLCNLEHDAIYAPTNEPTAAAFADVLNVHVADYHGIRNALRKRAASSSDDSQQQPTKIPKDNVTESLFSVLADLEDEGYIQPTADVAQPSTDVAQLSNIATVFPLGLSGTVEQREETAMMLAMISAFTIRNVRSQSFTPPISAMIKAFSEEMRSFISFEMCMYCNNDQRKKTQITLVKKDTGLDVIYNLCTQTKCHQEYESDYSGYVSKLQSMWSCSICGVPTARVVASWVSARSSLYCSVCSGIKQSKTCCKFELIANDSLRVKDDVVYVTDFHLLDELNKVRERWDKSVLLKLRNHIKVLTSREPKPN